MGGKEPRVQLNDHLAAEVILIDASLSAKLSPSVLAPNYKCKSNIIHKCTIKKRNIIDQMISLHMHALVIWHSYVLFLKKI